MVGTAEQPDRAIRLTFHAVPAILAGPGEDEDEAAPSHRNPTTMNMLGYPMHWQQHPCDAAVWRLRDAGFPTDGPYAVLLGTSDTMDGMGVWFFAAREEDLKAGRWDRVVAVYDID